MNNTTTYTQMFEQYSNLKKQYEKIIDARYEEIEDIREAIYNIINYQVKESKKMGIEKEFLALKKYSNVVENYEILFSKCEEFDQDYDECDNIIDLVVKITLDETYEISNEIVIRDFLRDVSFHDYQVLIDTLRDVYSFAEIQYENFVKSLLEKKIIAIEEEIEFLNLEEI
jgi:hypothetical protein